MKAKLSRVKQLARHIVQGSLLGIGAQNETTGEEI